MRVDVPRCSALPGGVATLDDVVNVSTACTTDGAPHGVRLQGNHRHGLAGVGRALGRALGWAALRAVQGRWRL